MPTAALSRASLFSEMPQSSDSSPSKQSRPTVPLSDLDVADIFDGLSHTAGRATCPGDSLDKVHRNMYDLSLGVVAPVEGGGGSGEGRGSFHAYGRSLQTIDPRIPTTAETEHVGFSTTRQTLYCLH